jgi:hypothetical protein
VDWPSRRWPRRRRSYDGKNRPANTLLAIAAGATSVEAHGADALGTAVKPTLDDLGLVCRRPAGSGAMRLSSRRLLISPEVDRAASQVLGPLGGRPTLAFLANAMTPLVHGKPAAASIPYSTVVGIDTSSLPVGDLVDDQGKLVTMPGPDEIVIDRWMADDLASQGVPVAVGDSIRLQYFLPETLHGRVEGGGLHAHGQRHRQHGRRRGRTGSRA